MNAQFQQKNESATGPSATAQKLAMTLKDALKSGAAEDNKVRNALWETLDAFRSGEITESEAVAVAELFVVDRIVEASRGKYRQRFRAAMALDANEKAEERGTRDPFSYAGALERKANAAARKQAEAEERLQSIKRFNREAGQALAAKMGEEFTADFALENLPEITAQAAVLAEKATHKAALVEALKAADKAGLLKEYVLAEVEQIFA